MRAFVVRVYGAGQGAGADHDHLMGIVEEVATGVQARFRNTEELVTVLGRPEDPAAKLAGRRPDAPPEPLTCGRGITETLQDAAHSSNEPSTGEVPE